MTECVKILAKALRSFSLNKPLKLDCTRLVSKSSLGFLLSGLKSCNLVTYLSLRDCNLDDEDLERIVARL